MLHCENFVFYYILKFAYIFVLLDNLLGGTQIAKLVFRASTENLV